MLFGNSFFCILFVKYCLFRICICVHFISTGELEDEPRLENLTLRIEERGERRPEIKIFYKSSASIFLPPYTK